MTKREYAPFDAADYLNDLEDVAGYLELALEESAEDPSAVPRALGVIARSQNMSELARRVGMSRDGLLGDRTKRRKAGLLQLSVGELVNISRSMHAQVVKAPGVPELPPGDGPAQLLPAGSSTPAQLEALLQAIQRGDHVEMQRIVFNGGGRNDQPVAVS